MSDNIKRIKASDLVSPQARAAVGIREDFNEHLGPAPHGGFKTAVTMRDSTGRVCFSRRPNLILLRGRTFTLERLFNDGIGAQGVTTGARPYVSDLDRKVMAFAVGKGGTPGGDPFSPYAPAPSELWLADPVPFRMHDTDAELDGDPLTFTPAPERGNYGGREAVSGQPTQTHLTLKHFDALDPEWEFNAADNTVYKRIALVITPEDCRTLVSNMINELCLIFTKATGVDSDGFVTFASPEAFSRITFPTEYLYDNKGLEVEYLVYA